MELNETRDTYLLVHHAPSLELPFQRSHRTLCTSCNKVASLNNQTPIGQPLSLLVFWLLLTIMIQTNRASQKQKKSYKLIRHNGEKHASRGKDSYKKLTLDMSFPSKTLLLGMTMIDQMQQCTSHGVLPKQ